MDCSVSELWNNLSFYRIMEGLESMKVLLCFIYNDDFDLELVLKIKFGVVFFYYKEFKNSK